MPLNILGSTGGNTGSIETVIIEVSGRVVIDTGLDRITGIVGAFNSVSGVYNTGYLLDKSGFARSSSKALGIVATISGGLITLSAASGYNVTPSVTGRIIAINDPSKKTL